jgi:hypothetical protein
MWALPALRLPTGASSGYSGHRSGGSSASVTGRYFEDCKDAEPHRPGIRRGVAACALDPEAAARLWQVSIDTLAGQRPTACTAAGGRRSVQRSASSS